jgi:hypothetical protein
VVRFPVDTGDAVIRHDGRGGATSTATTAPALFEKVNARCKEKTREGVLQRVSYWTKIGPMKIKVKGLCVSKVILGTALAEATPT